MTLPNSPASSSRSLVEHMFAAEFAFMQAGGTDPALLASAFHPEVVVHEPASLPYAGDWRGLPGIAALIGKMGEAWSDMTIENLEVAGGEACVLLACRLKLTVRHGGAVIDRPFAERLRFEDGRLIEGTPFYFDTAELVAALAR
jgi:ketosteroid isomerase-like protein